MCSLTVRGKEMLAKREMRSRFDAFGQDAKLATRTVLHLESKIRGWSDLSKTTRGKFRKDGSNQPVMQLRRGPPPSLRIVDADPNNPNKSSCKVQKEPMLRRISNSPTPIVSIASQSNVVSREVGLQEENPGNGNGHHDQYTPLISFRKATWGRTNAKDLTVLEPMSDKGLLRMHPDCQQRGGLTTVLKHVAKSNTRPVRNCFFQRACSKANWEERADWTDPRWGRNPVISGGPKQQWQLQVGNKSHQPITDTCAEELWSVQFDPFEEWVGRKAECPTVNKSGKWMTCNWRRQLQFLGANAIRTSGRGTLQFGRNPMIRILQVDFNPRYSWDVLQTLLKTKFLRSQVLKIGNGRCLSPNRQPVGCQGSSNLKGWGGILLLCHYTGIHRNITGILSTNSNKALLKIHKTTRNITDKDRERARELWEILNLTPANKSCRSELSRGTTSTSKVTVRRTCVTGGGPSPRTSAKAWRLLACRSRDLA